MHKLPENRNSWPSQEEEATTKMAMMQPEWQCGMENDEEDTETPMTMTMMATMATTIMTTRTPMMTTTKATRESIAENCLVGRYHGAIPIREDIDYI